MRPVHSAVGAAVMTAVLVVAALALGTVGAPAALAGAAVPVVAGILLVRAVRRRGTLLGPADVVTLARVVLAGLVTALVVERLLTATTSGSAVAVVSLLAIVLDGVDGRVARRTGTTSELGARFDMETDAFLILVLSAAVAAMLGPWVLLIGAARYVFVAASWVWPWLTAPSPPRYWCKVVAVVQGVVLAVVSTGALPAPLAVLVTAIALALLVESFGRDIVWHVRHRDGRTPAPVDARRRRRRSVATTGVALLLVWVALLVPDEVGGLSASVWLAIPLEGVVLAAVVGVAGPRTGRVLAAVAGAGLGVVVLVKALDLGFVAALGRPFQPLSDWPYLGSVPALVADSTGPVRAQLLVVAAVVLAVGVLLMLPTSAYHLAGVAQRHRRPTLVTATALGLAWVLASVTGLQVGPASVASARSASVVARDVDQTVQALSDERDFVAAAADDPWARVPSDRLLSALRGKDVLVVFVESYGRAALEDLPGSAALRAQLDAGTARLGRAGVAGRSAWLTSPTFAGISWLAHATLQSGTWVDTQRRYDALLTTHRLTLASAFANAGWRTVDDVPANEEPWPEGQAFYGYTQVYDERTVGYAGPRFGYAMPDQYTLDAFRRLELGAGHAPVMAEIDLASSHAPWTPLPRPVPWRSVGDGSVFRTMTGPAATEVWPDPVKVRSAYEASISYSLGVVESFLEMRPSKDLVVLMLGDHQPASIVSGAGASHEVPVTLLSSDPAVLAAVDGWGWRDGLRPDATAPVWRMDALRDRLLSAYSS